jgi:hypothetical protein
MSETKYFYDIHCHAMNLSHPNLYAMAKRKWTLALLMSPLAPLAQIFLKEKVKKASNLLSVMENDVTDFFLITEFFLKKDGQELRIGDTAFDKIVLTPLLMDFGSKDIKSDTFYNSAPQKPIAEQVVDVFNGIKDYCRYKLVVKNDDIDYDVDTKERKLFEIYPFLGINTRNYKLKDVNALFDKYFSEYKHDHQDLYDKMGTFEGDIDDMKSNFFAGVKVYPPLGFDPWPQNDAEELEKVRCLYRHCCEKNISITTHCSDGGFSIVDDAKELTSPAKWRTVLSQTEFNGLRLNFAHFGRQGNKWYGARNRDWENMIVELILSGKNNVYVDFSYRGCEDGYYDDLKKLIDKQAGKDKDLLKQRILFGSDFMINLLDCDSYNQYLAGFMGKGNQLDVEERIRFCSINPERFLFGQ